MGLRNLFKRRPAQTPALGFDTALCHGIGGRDNDEDAFGHHLAESAAGCWVVADGVGGQGAGEIASNRVVHCIVEGFQSVREHSASRMKTLLETAHEDIRRGRAQSPEAADMASTVVALIIATNRAVWAHVGDSRLYHFRRGRFESRTADHSLAQLMVARGALAESDLKRFPQRNVILQALGQAEPPEISVSGPVAVEAGDAFLLCTDGFWEYVSEEEMTADLQSCRSAREWLDRMERRLPQVQAREAAGMGTDNYTALGVRVIAPSD